MKKTEKKSVKSTMGLLWERPLTLWDFGLFLLICLSFFLFYQMRDLFHTAGCSYGYLDGHIFDFYDYLAESGIAEDGTVGLHASYLPTIYILFAIWNLPMKIFGIVPAATAKLGVFSVMWAKILPCLAFLASGYVLYLIGKELGFSVKKAKLCMFVYLTAPVALFTQFAMGQYESFTVLLVLLGVYFWLRKKSIWFVFCFALAFTFKYTVLIFYLPLLLLREKNIWRILLLTLCVFAIAMAEILIYYPSETFRAYAFGIGSAGDNPTGYLTNAAYFTGYSLNENLKTVVYLAFLAFAAVIAYAYFFRPADDAEERKYAMYFMCLSGAALFCFSKFHPQWLLLMVPFWTLTTYQHKNTKIFLALEMLFGVLFLMFTVTTFFGVCDETMMTKGVLKFALPDGLSKYVQMKDYFGIVDSSVVLSLVTAMMLVFAVFKHPKFMRENMFPVDVPNMGWIRARYLVPCGLFLLVSLFVFLKSLSLSPSSYCQETFDTYVRMNDGEICVQEFISESDRISKIKFPISLGENENKENRLLVTLSDEAGTVLYEEEFFTIRHYEGEWLSMNVGKDVKEGGKYFLTFSLTPVHSYEGYDDTTFSLLASSEEGIYEKAKKGNRSRDYHLALTVYQ